MYSVLHGDCRDVISTIESDSIDAVVTDPPYGIGISAWDSHVPDTRVWAECLRVLKPGGFLFSFSSPRLQHKIASNIEGSGFTIKDSMIWLYGTGFPKPGCLKPAHEPIIIAKKPGKSTLNVAACRFQREHRNYGLRNARRSRAHVLGKHDTSADFDASNGRWPANVVHDGDVLDPSVARYFYCARATAADRGKCNTHPTVKPEALMRHIVKLALPSGGTVLDPFAGSGSTGKAAVLEGFNFIGIERDIDYVNIAIERIREASL
jgi:adenine-specific DNA-methyltransferase